MNVIELLSEHISNQIAAGEVIQRPSSVVKELLENGIDAGATEIKVHIKNGGRTNIVIQDNGKGMSPDDAILSFKRHATSKLKDVDDLFKMQTKGFRGEALASIGAIAQVSMKTKHKDSNGNGIQIEYAGGKLVEKEECVCDIGTLIEVKNIFFNAFSIPHLAIIFIPNYIFFAIKIKIWPGGAFMCFAPLNEVS